MLTMDFATLVWVMIGIMTTSIDAKGTDGSQSVIGGEEIIPNSRPYLVSVGDGPSGYYDQVCGGTLISPHSVMTAAHCILREIDNVLQWKPLKWVEFHRHNMFNDTGVRRIYLEDTSQCDGDLVTHPDYDQDFHPKDWHSTYDVAVLFLPEPITDITPVIMNTDPKVPVAYAPVEVAGYGRTENGYPDVPFAATVKYITNKACTEKPYRYDKNELAESLMCAGLKGKDSCYGDSGGPLVLAKDLPEGGPLHPIVQVGIVSGGPWKCARPTLPGTYTRVSAVADWVKKTVCARTGELCSNSKTGKMSKAKVTKDECVKLPTYAPTVATSYEPTISAKPTTGYPSYIPTTYYPTWTPTTGGSKGAKLYS